MAKRIVLIEDNKDVRENIEELLTLSGYEVMTAGDGKEGAALVVNEVPDMIVCDIMMPVLDGYGVLKIVSSNEATKDIPFIFLSAKAEQTDFRKGMNLGADDYITKPFEDVQLLEAIEMRIKKNEGKVREKEVTGIENFYNEQQAMEALEELFHKTEALNLDRKERLFKENSAPNYIYWLRNGMIKTSQTNNDGKELITGLYGKQDFIGLTDIFGNSSYSETARAIQESVVFRASKVELLQLVNTNSDVAMFMYRKLAFSVQIRKMRLLHLAYDSVRMRTADSLLWIDEIYNYNKEYPFQILFNREDMAAMVGTAKESLIRNLSSFKEEKLIDTDFSKITIFDVKGLQEIVGC